MSILNNGDLMRKRRLVFLGVGLAIVFATLSSPLQAHPMDEQNAAFVQAVDGVAVFPFMYLGAKHMVTGYDHLLFLVGVIFFLYKWRQKMEIQSRKTIWGGHIYINIMNTILKKILKRDHFILEELLNRNRLTL